MSELYAKLAAHKKHTTIIRNGKFICLFGGEFYNIVFNIYIEDYIANDVWELRRN